MPRRSVLTERQRLALFDLPTDEASMLRHYTLADDDLEHINDRLRSENRIGFALQLFALRYPGRPLSSDEVIPEKVLRFLAAQLGLTGDDIKGAASNRDRSKPHRCEFMHAAENMVLIGGRGTGKSHLTTFLGVQAIEHHRKLVRFFSTVELVKALEPQYLITS
jgi:TnpA family transposase